MQKFAIVKREEEKDLLIGTIEALSFEQAEKVADQKYGKEKQSLQRGEAWLIVELEGNVVFDEKNRVVNLTGNMDIFYKF